MADWQHLAEYLAQEAQRSLAWLSALEREKRSAGLDFAADCLKRDIAMIKAAIQGVSDGKL